MEELMIGLRKHRYWVEGAETVQAVLCPFLVMIVVLMLALGWWWFG
jgi:hypothetical protein